QKNSEPEKLAEIVVTAQRRSERLQDVPLSIAAYDQADITRLGISSVDDILRLTPGLDQSRNGSYQPAISIRGIASFTGASPTGIYVDDTPIQVRDISVN